MIGQIEKNGWTRRGRSEVTVDSAADESVCPKEWGDVFDLKDVEPGREMKLTNANGEKLSITGSVM